MQKTVSVVVPVRNESRYIDGFLESLDRQTFARKDMEWIFVDGASDDDTVEKLNAYARNHPDLVRVLANPDKTVPYAMNIGIRASEGKYIIRLDAHSFFAPDYIERCVWHLDHTDADNVGGIARSAGRTETGKTIAVVLRSPFGVGNSQFRTGGRGGYVDTVPFGAYRREIFDRIGYYDERLTRNQDNELNFRIRESGGKILLAKDIRFRYYGRDTVRGLLRMARQNGYWNVITMQLMPGSMGIRHFVPLLFVLSLLILPLLSLAVPWFFKLLIAELILYGVLNLYYSATGARSLRQFLQLLVLFPLFHIHYGLGSLYGIFRTFVTRDTPGTPGTYRRPE